MKKFHNIIKILSFSALIIGTIVNPSRWNNRIMNEFTAKILGLPEWTYQPVLYLEHIFGVFALGIFFYTAISFIPNICIKNIKKESFRATFIISYFAMVAITLIWEYIIEQGKTLDQVPFDFIGMFLFVFYMVNWFYPSIKD